MTGREIGHRVRFGIEIQHRPELLGPVAVRAEALGFDSVWVGDHLAFHNPTLDALGALSYVAALTRRVRIGPCVYLLALRHPTTVAKQVAALDVLSGGRLVFGVGVGGEFPKEFEAAGVPHRERGARVDEGIAVCRALWGPSPVSFEGRFTRFADVVFEPKPLQPGGPPIWIGGRSDAALRRAAQLGDGWVSYLVTPERFRASLGKIEAFAREAGRPLGAGRSFEPAHVLFTVVDDDMAAAHATAAGFLERQYQQPFDDLAKKYCLLGPPAACAERLAEFVAAGVRTLIIYFTVPAARIPDQLERFAAEIMPRAPEWSGHAAARP
jgi:probable F420-dependent oxidoreductase